jgi:type II secretory pathway component PulC
LQPTLYEGGQSTPKPTAQVAASREPITDYLRPNPVYDGDRLKGYEVYPGSKPGMFARLQLQPGDLVTHVDGASVADLAAGLDAFRPLLDGAPVTATVVRHGQSIGITIDGAAIFDAENTAAPAADPPAAFNAPVRR